MTTHVLPDCWLSCYLHSLRGTLIVGRLKQQLQNEDHGELLGRRNDSVIQTTLLTKQEQLEFMFGNQAIILDRFDGWRPHYELIT